MYITKYLVSFTLATISILSFAQNNSEPKYTQQASICLNASNTLELIVNIKNIMKSDSDRRLAFDKIDSASLPLAQKYRLNGLVSLLYSTSNLSNSTEILNSKQIAVEYYLSCMSDR